MERNQGISPEKRQTKLEASRKVWRSERSSLQKCDFFTLSAETFSENVINLKSFHLLFADMSVTHMRLCRTMYLRCSSQLYVLVDHVSVHSEYLLSLTPFPGGR